MPAIGHDHKAAAGNKCVHFLRQLRRSKLISIADQNECRTSDLRQAWARIRPPHNGALLAHEGLRAGFLRHLHYDLSQRRVVLAVFVHQ